MSQVQRASAWADFTAAFFSAPNELPAAGDEATKKTIARAEEAWLASPAAPFFLPVRASHWTYWYAICPDQEQRLWVRDLIQAHVGSWTDFSGQPVSADSDLPMDEAVRVLTGPRGCSFRLLIPRNDDAEAHVRQILDRLTRSLAARPYRRIQLVWPLGRLIGDFWDACASGSQTGAEDLLDLLNQDTRLSKANRLFLRLQYLAVFEEWDRLEALDQLPDLVRLDRPVLATDALARLAMARLAADATLDDFERSTSAFGCLLNTVAAIRSAAGAQYYAFWSLSSGETAEVVAARLLESGWLDQARRQSGLASLLAAQSLSEGKPAAAPDPADLRRVLAEGRFDAAIDALALVAPSADLLPRVIELVTKTLTPASIKLLQRWRNQLGEAAVQEILLGQLVASGRELDVAAEHLGSALEQAFSDSLAAAERARALEDLRIQAVPRLMRTGELRQVVEAVRSLSRSVDSNRLPDLIDVLLDMERDLFTAAGDVPGIQDLRLTTVEAWALGDESGERHRVARLLDLVGRVLGTGVSPVIFDELVESFRAGWTPMLTDADLPLSLEAIEILAASKPEAAVALPAFAALILSRIGVHNARRIDPAALETVRALAPEFGIELANLPTPDDQYAAGKADRVQLPPGTLVVIYSLMEPAVRRAAEIVRRWFPEIRVETFTEKVANDSLRYAAGRADLLVIADKAAAHAATDAIKAARGRKPIQYARGKGTASLIDAVVAGLEATYGEALAAVS